MVKTENFCPSPPCSAWQSSNFNGFSVSGIRYLKAQQNGVNKSHQCVPTQFQNLLPATSLFCKENLSMFSYGHGGEAAPNSNSGCRRKFVIFDQSGTEARLMCRSFYPTFPKPSATAARQVHDYSLHFNEQKAKMQHVDLAKHELYEVTDENHLKGEESEMHEDTEEINALLYSDDDEYDHGGSDNDDEVTSTGHSPIQIGLNCGETKRVEEITGEVASSDGPTKRRRLLDGGHKKLFPLDTASSVKLEHQGYEDDAESRYVIGQTKEEEMVSILGNKQLKKDKIRAMLKNLESIIPGAKEKEPLLVLDEAINYLKYLKLKAQAVGANYH